MVIDFNSLDHLWEVLKTGAACTMETCKNCEPLCEQHGMVNYLYSLTRVQRTNRSII